MIYGEQPPGYGDFGRGRASQLSGFCPQSLAFALSRRLREQRRAGLLSAACWAAGLYRGASAAAIWEMESSVAVFSSGVAILGLEMAIFEAGNGRFRGRKRPLLSCIVSGPFRRASEGAGGGQHGQARRSTKKGGCAKVGAPSGGGIRMGLSGVIVGNAPSPASGRQAGEGTCQRIYLMTFLPLTM